MRQALEFFPRYFPDKPFVGFACGSWILNPEMDRIYRPDSNMVLWQRELYLYPLANHPNSRSGLHFIFGTNDVDPGDGSARHQSATCPARPPRRGRTPARWRHVPAAGGLRMARRSTGDLYMVQPDSNLLTALIPTLSPEP